MHFGPLSPYASRLLANRSRSVAESQDSLWAKLCPKSSARSGWMQLVSSLLVARAMLLRVYLH